MAELRICALIPTYDNPRTLGSVVREVRKHLGDVIVIDDGSADEGRRVAMALAEEGLVTLGRRDRRQAG